MNKIWILMLLVMSLPLALAVNFNETISSADKASFDQILSPVMKIYNFVKYTASVIAVLFLLFVGVTFVISGGDQAKREQAKTNAMYIVIGLVVIWIAPLIVSFLVK